MKKTLSIVIVLLILLLSSFYITGLMTERTLRKNIVHVNQNKGIYVEISQYTRGFFQSHTNFKWQISVPARIVYENGIKKQIPGQEYFVDMPLTIYHGPIIFADNSVQFGLGYGHSQVQLPQKYLVKFNELFTPASTKPQLALNVLVNFLNNTSLKISVPKFDLIAKADKSHFQWQGLESKTTVSDKLESVKGSLNMLGFNLSKDDTTLNAGKLTTVYNLYYSDVGVYLGNVTFNFPTIVVKQNQNKMFELQNLAMESNSQINDDLFHTSSRLSMKQVIINNKTYGPAEVQVSLKNLDAHVLGDINQKVNQLQSNASTDQKQILFNVLPDLPKLVAKGAKFEISQFYFKMPEGDINGKLVISLPKGENNNPFAMVKQVNGEGSLTVPKTVFYTLLKQSYKDKLMKASPEVQSTMVKSLQAQKPDPEVTLNNPVPTNAQPMSPVAIENAASVKAKQKIATLVQSGALIQDAQGYTVNLLLANGELTVNGQPFSMQMFN